MHNALTMVIKHIMRIVLLTALSACVAAPIPTPVSPTRVHLLSEVELRTHMQDMATRVAVIAFITLDTELTMEQQGAQVLPLLDSIQSIAAQIDGDGATTNYSVINRYMSDFLYDVALAKEFARREPPNLVPAQRLVKSCMSCHESF